MLKLLAFAACGLFGYSSPTALAQDPVGSITVDITHPGYAIPANFYGLMTEEINHAYDGGLYAELIQNRSFRDRSDSAVHWTLTGPGSQLTLEPGDTPAIKVDPGAGNAELSNSGYWGIPVRPNTTYKLTLRAKGSSEFRHPIKVAIESNDGSKTFGETTISRIDSEWKTYRFSLKTGLVESSQANKFVISVSGPGSVEFNYVSLFPPTFHGRPNGNRADLMTLLGGLKPSFLRLPGGNYLEGDTIQTRFEWKNTIGKPIDRIGHRGPWGYRSSDGLGLLEFLEWCEDLRMQPLLAVYAGYSLRGEHVNPGPDLAPYVQDAIDEIEYVTGDASTKWGSERAKDGHPKPFPLSYVEVGNEDWFDRSRSYDARYAQFHDAIKAKYPKLQLIATMPVQSRKPDVVDDHYYRAARDMAVDSGHYDSISRSGPKIFVGEWASTQGNPTPNMEAALGDAAWLTGLERDSDLVIMESYAPLLVNVNRGAAQWGTNLIGYDALNSFGSPSYYVQSMFASYTGDVVVPIQLKLLLPPTTQLVSGGAIGLATWRTDAEYKDLEVTHDGATLFKSDFTSGSDGLKPLHGTWALDQGTYRQSSAEEGTLAIAGDPTWKNYTYRLKARKLGGDEGFMIPFHVKDDQNFWRWNIGGWDDTRTRIQRIEDGVPDEVGPRSNVTIEPNRWYDIRIEVQGDQIRCYLDDKLVSQATEMPRPPVDAIYAAASKKLGNGHLLLKVVNFSDSDLSIKVGLGGAKLRGTATGWIMTGARSDVNSIESPTKVVPKKISLKLDSSFIYTFPARSVTVLDVPSH